jgi:phosphomannomutase
MKRVAIVVLAIVLGCLSACSSRGNEGGSQTFENSSEKSSIPKSEVHLQEALRNSFTLNWFDEMRKLEDIVKFSVTADGPEYLLGYIDSDLNTHSNLKIIFTSQSGLSGKIIPKNLETALGNFSVAKTSYLQNLRQTLSKNKTTPMNPDFQTNSKKLATLIDDLFVSVPDLKNEDTCLTFQHNLEKATAYMEAAFPKK